MRNLVIAGMVLAAGLVFAEEALMVLQVNPASGSPVDCYNQPVGTKKELVFELPLAAKEVISAKLAMMVDDIDSREEATIRLNGGEPLAIPDDAIAEGQFHPSFMDVPLDQLRDGRNVFEFTFVSNLGNTTSGFVIDEAYLMLTVAQETAQKAASKPGVKVRTQSSVADMIEHRGEEPLFTVTGAREREDAFEVPSPFVFPKIMDGKDGDILMMQGNELKRSADGGRTWGPVEKMPIGVSCILRLKSGILGARSNMDFHVSADEGKTWEKRGSIAAAAERQWTGEGVAHFDVLMQTKSGRIFLPTRGSAAANEWLGLRSRAFAIVGGELKSIEGHAHRPEADYTIVYYSDDEGKSWKRSDGAIMVWKDDGFGGMWPCDEPNIIELTNGDVMLYFRTTLGRIYLARSGPVEFVQTSGPRKGQTVKGTPGEYWEYPCETDLAGAYTPCRVRRIPSTGDLLLVWNQVSGDEMRGGYSRGRLSSAISRDDGKTWEHFRTIDRTVLPPAGRVAPDPEPGMARAFDFVGELPDDHGMVDYPNIGFHADTVLVTWIRAIIKPRPGQFTGGRLLVAPVSWFYEDEPACVPPKPTPTLQVNGVEVPSLYIDNRFLVNLTDVAKALGRKVTANMFAPIHQTLTYFGEKPVYDESGMGD
ncbi:MAG: sialidase family protein, partial [Planctomycetota bacterium]